MSTIKTVTAYGLTGAVFFDDEWDAYGYEVEQDAPAEFAGANGPFDDAEEAEERLRGELRAAAYERDRRAIHRRLCCTGALPQHDDHPDRDDARERAHKHINDALANTWTEDMTPEQWEQATRRRLGLA